MRVYVIRSAVGIVLRDKNRHIRPPGGMRKIIHYAPQRVIVVGNVGGMRRIAILWPGISHVVLWQVNKDELRQRRAGLSMLHIKPVNLTNKGRRPELIRDIHVEIRII